MENKDKNLNKKCFELLTANEEVKAFSCFLENSKTGDSMANYMVGEMYLNGTGTQKDYTSAIKNYLDSNEPLSLYRLVKYIIKAGGWM